jgi:hypothetical protein
MFAILSENPSSSVYNQYSVLYDIAQGSCALTGALHIAAYRVA